jgi:hypothetical protein
MAQSHDLLQTAAESTHVVPSGEERKDGRDHVIAFAFFSLPRRRSLLRGRTFHVLSGPICAIAIRLAFIEYQDAFHPTEARRSFTSAVQPERAPLAPRYKPGNMRSSSFKNCHQSARGSVDQLHFGRRALVRASQGRVHQALDVRPRPPPHLARLVCAPE